MVFLYSVIAHLAAFLLAPVIVWRALFSDRSYSDFLGVLRHEPGKRYTDRCLWVHASSVGEVKACAELIRSIRGREPEVRILLTVFTSRGMKVARAAFESDIETRYLPLDIPIIVRRAFSVLNPGMLVITETELWPSLMREAFLRKVPVAILNGRLSDSGIRRYLALKPLFEPLIRQVAYIHAQSDSDAGRFLRLGAKARAVHAGKNIKTAGMFSNLRRFDRQSVLNDLGLAPEARIVVCGSTREGEEEILLDAFESVRSDHPDLRMLLAPRHSVRVDDVERMVRERKFHSVRRSVVGSAGGGDWDVLILDTMGELWKMYGVGICAFVGGSLVPIGGHNPLEPLALGVPTCFGPYMDNARELADICVRERLARVVSDASDFARFIGLCAAGETPLPSATRIRTLFVSDLETITDRILSLWGATNA